MCTASLQPFPPKILEICPWAKHCGDFKTAESTHVQPRNFSKRSTLGSVDFQVCWTLEQYFGGTRWRSMLEIVATRRSLEREETDLFFFLNLKKPTMLALSLWIIHERKHESKAAPKLTITPLLLILNAQPTTRFWCPGDTESNGALLNTQWSTFATLKTKAYNTTCGAK